MINRINLSAIPNQDTKLSSGSNSELITLIPTEWIISVSNEEICIRLPEVLPDFKPIWMLKSDAIKDFSSMDLFGILAPDQLINSMKFYSIDFLNTYDTNITLVEDIGSIRILHILA